MNVQIYLNIYDKRFGRLEKITYLCIVNNGCSWNNIKNSNRRVSGVIRHRFKIPARAKIETPTFVGVLFLPYIYNLYELFNKFNKENIIGVYK